MIIQIYEIQTPEEAETCIRLGVDHVGSVLLSEDDWKQRPIREVMRLSKGTPTKNSIIPLFKNRDVIYKLLDYYRPHILHFCETLDLGRHHEALPERFFESQTALKERFPEIRIMRSVPLPRQGANLPYPVLSWAKALEPVTDLFLTDTWLGKEPVAGYVGITGMTCDWELAKGLVEQSRIPVILAGGLSPENVYHALMKVSPAGADSCTHTNRVDVRGNPIRFQKDFDKVKAFVEEVQRYEGDGS
jgi:phosphoribosylanthranilate isomerase